MRRMRRGGRRQPYSNCSKFCATRAGAVIERKGRSWAGARFKYLARQIGLEIVRLRMTIWERTSRNSCRRPVPKSLR
jgi:hypothetical protein